MPQFLERPANFSEQFLYSIFRSDYRDRALHCQYNIVALIHELFFYEKYYNSKSQYVIRRNKIIRIK